MGGDIYLREGDEGDLHRHAIDNILLATITQLIANTPNRLRRLIISRLSHWASAPTAIILPTLK